MSKKEHFSTSSGRENICTSCWMHNQFHHEVLTTYTHRIWELRYLRFTHRSSHLPECSCKLLVITLFTGLAIFSIRVVTSHHKVQLGRCQQTCSEAKNTLFNDSTSDLPAEKSRTRINSNRRTVISKCST